MPWLIAVIVMMAFSAIWFHLESKAQQRIQIEQTATMLQFSVRPILKDKDTDVLKAQLNNIRLTSVVPLAAIAVYSQQHRLLVVAGAAELVAEGKPENAVTSYTAQVQTDGILVFQPLTADSSMQVAAEQQYYMALLFTPVNGISEWFLPAVIVGLIGIVVLMILHNNLQHVAQRQHTDVSLLTHKLNQLRHGQLNVSITEELVPELQPLKAALNELTHYLTENANQLGTELQQMQQKTAQQLQQLSELQQQYNKSELRHTQFAQLVQSRLTNLHQMQQQQTELEETEFLSAMEAQIALLKLELGGAEDVPASLNLTQWFSEQLPQIRQYFKNKDIELQVFEGGDNICHEVCLPAQQLSLLLHTIMQVGGRVGAVSELTLRLALNVRQSETNLQISVTGNGDGIPPRVKQLLNSDDTRTLQWHESDIGILLVLKRCLQGVLTVQSLDGLGCTVTLTLPVAECLPLVAPRKMPHLLLFDSQSNSLTERSQVLNTLTDYLAKCSDLNELARKSKQFAYDVAIVMLPEPADLASWCSEIQHLKARSRVLCYAAKSQQAVWQEALQYTVHEMPFCLNDMLSEAPAQAELPQLLVVDDNATNLAFIQVLLKDQPVKLHTATCGVDALKLCQQQTFDVVLLDIQLPDIAGTEVARRLRQLTEYQHIPILAFTAHALDEEVSSFLSAGMNDVIFKPFEAAKLDIILRWCSSGKADHISQ